MLQQNSLSNSISWCLFCFCFYKQYYFCRFWTKLLLFSTTEGSQIFLFCCIRCMWPRSTVVLFCCNSLFDQFESKQKLMLSKRMTYLKPFDLIFKLEAKVRFAVPILFFLNPTVASFVRWVPSGLLKLPKFSCSSCLKWYILFSFRHLFTRFIGEKKISRWLPSLAEH